MKTPYDDLESLLIRGLKEYAAGYDPRNHTGSWVILQEIMKCSPKNNVNS